MDKYQKYLFSLFSCVYKFGIEGCESSNYSEGILIDNDADNITIIQNEDINKTKYVLYINGQRNKETVILSAVYIFKDNAWKEVKGVENIYKIQVDFDDRIEKIKLSFMNNLADDYIINIIYQEADKEKYNEKLAMEHKAELLKVANIKVSTGADLVNIYFQPCCDDCVRTEIVLFKDNMMLAKYKIDEETFFKSIGGLAYGKYTFVLKQFDKDSNALFETEHIAFTISSPKPQGIMPSINIY